MTHYKSILSSVAILALLTGCNSSSENNNASEATVTPTKSSIEASAIEKNEAVFATEDSLVTTMGERALTMSEGEFIDKSIAELVPELVTAYVPDSYVDELINSEELNPETLKANRALVEELQKIYAMSHTSEKQRALNTSELYESVSTISGEIYDIIYNYFFGDATLESVYDDVVGSVFGEDNATTQSSTSQESEASSSSVSSAASSEAVEEASSSSVAEEEKSTVQEKTEEAVTKVEEKVEKTVEKIEEKKEEVVEKVEEVVEKVEEKTEKVVEKVEETVEKVQEKVEETVTKVEEKVEESVDKVKDTVDAVKNIIKPKEEIAEEETPKEETTTANDETSTLQTFISVTDIPKVDNWNYPKAYYRNYTITSFKKVEETLNEADSVLVKILIPAGASKVTLEAKGSKDFFDGSRVGIFSEDVGNACGENSVCSLETLSALRNDSTYIGAKFSDVVYEGDALAEAEYRYVVIYNKNGGSDDVSYMKTQITIEDKNSYNDWRDEAL